MDVSAPPAELPARAPVEGTFGVAKTLYLSVPLITEKRYPMADSLKAQDKVENPEVHFDKPKEVVQDNTLSQDEKKSALDTWEQDERQLLTASNEGMSGTNEGLRSENDNRLDEVISAKEKIGEKPKHKSSH